MGSARALTLGMILLSTACTPLDDALVAIFGRSMRDQRSFDPYENPRLPAEGSVPFASGNFPAAPFDVNLGQPESLDQEPPPFTQLMVLQQDERVTGLLNPVPSTDQSLARGQEMFERSCAPCHGTDGIGANAYIIEVHPLLAAYDIAGAQAAGYADGYIYGMIRVGRGVMPSYGHQISHFDRWHIVNYVRQLQAQNGVGPGADDGDSEADSEGADGS
jgi:mono/diheme cytochrome c family protein